MTTSNQMIGEGQTAALRLVPSGWRCKVQPVEDAEDFNIDMTNFTDYVTEYKCTGQIETTMNTLWKHRT